MNTQQQNAYQHWRHLLTIEERQAVRFKIREACTNECKTYEELLEVFTALNEELLYMTVPSRVDYFKSSYEFRGRIMYKRKQLNMANISLNNLETDNVVIPTKKREIIDVEEKPSANKKVKR